MSLVAEYESSPESDNGWNKERNIEASERSGSESSSSYASDNNQSLKGGEIEATKKTSVVSKLPSAASVIQNCGTETSSVWANQYKKEDEEKTRALERHVKMVNNSKSTPLNGKINGKKVCWMYRRGRCRLGKKCQMYHDSELQTTDGSLKNHNTIDSVAKQAHSNSTLCKRPHSEITIDDSDDTNGSNSKLPKKKFGLSDDLIPSKKVIKHFETLTGSKTMPGQ